MADAGATENHDDAQPQPQTDRIRSLSISLEPLRDYELAPPAAMHKQIWKWLDYSIRKFATRKANQQVFGYLAAKVKDGFEQGLWTSSSTELTFTFPDTAGTYRMSSYAALRSSANRPVPMPGLPDTAEASRQAHQFLSFSRNEQSTTNIA
jgi:hypothetical protein